MQKFKNVVIAALYAAAAAFFSTWSIMASGLAIVAVGAASGFAAVAAKSAEKNPSPISATSGVAALIGIVAAIYAAFSGGMLWLFLFVFVLGGIVTLLRMEKTARAAKVAAEEVTS
jgi:hypothetical protein